MCHRHHSDTTHRVRLPASVSSSDAPGVGTTRRRRRGWGLLPRIVMKQEPHHGILFLVVAIDVLFFTPVMLLPSGLARVLSLVTVVLALVSVWSTEFRDGISLLQQLVWFLFFPWSPSCLHLSAVRAKS